MILCKEIYITISQEKTTQLPCAIENLRAPGESPVCLIIPDWAYIGNTYLEENLHPHIYPEEPP